MKFREIERLRAVAVLMVISAHWRFLYHAWPRLMIDGWSGVDLFFVISGYVVTLSLLRLLPPLDGAPDLPTAFVGAKDSLRVFYVRRLCRILPAALTAALLHRALGTIFPEQFGGFEQWFREMLEFLGGIYNYAKPVSGDDQIGVYWSLSVEEHFYLVLPMLFVIFRTRSKRIGMALIIIMAVVVLRPYFAELVPGIEGKINQEYYERFSSHLRFDSLMAGVALALLRSAPRRPILPPWFVQVTVVPAIILIVWMLPATITWYVMDRAGLVLLWAMCGLLVAYGGMDKGYILEIPLLGPILVRIGTLSYAMYLTHVDMMRLDQALQERFAAYKTLVSTSSDAGAWLHGAGLFCALLAVCSLLHVLVEKPFMRLGRNLVRETMEDIERPLATSKTREA